MLKLSMIHKLSIAQFFVLTVPLYVFSFVNEAIVSFALICVYLLIDINLDVLFRVANVLKWSKISIVFTGFFGVKNIFFILCLLLFWKANLLFQGIGVAFIILFNYAIYSFALGSKLLKLPNDEE